MKRNINLLPPEELSQILAIRNSHLLWWSGVWAILSFVVLTILILIGQVLAARSLEAVSAQVDQKQAQLKNLEERQVPERVLEINDLVANFKKWQSQRKVWSPWLQEYAQLIPADVSINTLTVSRSNGKAEIVGQAGTRAAVLALRENILSSENFININFPLYNLETATRVSWKYRFSVIPLVKP